MTTYTFSPTALDQFVDWSVTSVWVGGVVPNSPTADVTFPTVTVVPNGSVDASFVSIASSETYAVNSISITNNYLTINGILSAVQAIAILQGGEIDMAGGTLSAASLQNGGIDVQGNGQIQISGTITNGSSIIGSGLTLSANSLVNPGTLQAASGDLTVNVPSGGFANLSGTTLTGGTYAAGFAGNASTNTLYLNIGGLIVTDAATIELDAGGTIASFNDQTGMFVPLQSTLQSIAPSGTLSIANQTINFGTLTINGALILAGTSGIPSSIANRNAILNANQLIVSASGKTSGYGEIVGPIANSGIVIAEPITGTSVSNAVLDINGAVTGTGLLVIGPGSQGSRGFNAYAATLELSGPTSENVAFENNVGALQLDSPTGFTGKIAPSISAGDQIILTGVSSGSLTEESYAGTVTGGTLTFEESGTTSHLSFIGNYNLASFTFSAGPQLLSTSPPSLLITVGASLPESAYTVAQVLNAVAQGINLGAATIQDSSANVAANIDALEPLALAGEVASIAFTDTTTPILSITAAQYINDSNVFADISGSYSLNIQNASAANAVTIGAGAHIASIAVVDTAADIQTSLDQLEAISSYISSITIASAPNESSSLTISISPLQLSTDLSIIKEIQSQLTSAPGVDNPFPAATLTVSGNISLSEAITALNANSLFSGLNVVDSAVDVQNELAAAIPFTYTSELATIFIDHIHSIALTDAGTPTISISYLDIVSTAPPTASFNTQLAVQNFLGDISTPFQVSVENVPVSSATTSLAYDVFMFGTDVLRPGQFVHSLSILDASANVQANIDFLESLVLSNEVTAITVSDTTSPQLTFTAQQQLVDAQAIALIQGIDNGINPAVTAPPDPGHGIISEQGDSFQSTITPAGDDATFTISNQLTGTNTTANVNSDTYVKFSDITLVVANTNDASLARLYTAALDRPPDQGGLDGWENIYNNNVSAVTKAQGVYTSLGEVSGNFNGSLPIAYGFIDSAEFQSEYGSLNNTQFVTQLYANVLDRAPDSAGLAGWLSLMQNDGFTQGMVLVGFAESAENIAKDSAWLVTV